MWAQQVKICYSPSPSVCLEKVDGSWASVRTRGLTELVEQESDQMCKYKTNGEREDKSFALGIVLSFECPMSTHPLLC